MPIHHPTPAQNPAQNNGHLARPDQKIGEQEDNMMLQWWHVVNICEYCNYQRKWTFENLRKRWKMNKKHLRKDAKSARLLEKTDLHFPPSLCDWSMPQEPSPDVRWSPTGFNMWISYEKTTGKSFLKSWQNLRIQWSMNADLDLLFKELAQSCPEIRESMGKLWNFSAVKSDAMILPILSMVGILGLRLHLVILHVLEHWPSHVSLFREHVKGHICHRLDSVRLLALRAETSTSALAAAGLSSGINLQLLQEFCD